MSTDRRRGGTGSPAVRHVTVSADQAGQRIDNFLTRELKGVPRSRLYRAIRSGEVRVNKGRIAQTYRLQEDDIVRIPPIQHADPGRGGTAGEFDWRPHILHDDRHFLVVDKPSGWAVHGGSGVRHGVIESLRANLAHGQNLELVHRLDRSTSGCLIIARRRSVLRELHEQLRNRTTTKRYLLLVKGDWQLGQHEVDMPLDVEQRQGGQRTVGVAADGRRAVTRFALREQYGDASLIEAIPVTGRTHQIRVHAAHCGHPIAGDERYGDRDFNRKMVGYGLRRLFLHARALEFERSRQLGRAAGPTGGRSGRATGGRSAQATGERSAPVEPQLRPGVAEVHRQPGGRHRAHFFGGR